MAKANENKSKVPKWKLIPRVADIGFFQGALKSRRRLITVALITTVVEFAIIYFVSDWMRSRSGSPMVNVAIIAFMLTGLIIAAYFVALVIGDLFFPGRWRERVVLGTKFEPETWEEERAYVKEYNAHFYVIFIVMLLSLAWVSQRMTDGFLSWYQNLGFALTLMRSDNPDDRYLGLEEMANPLREEYWGDQDLHAQIALLVKDPDPVVQAMACYTGGRLNAVKAADPMLDVFRESENDEVRAACATSLGRLKWEKSLAYLSSRLKSASVEPVEQIGIVRGFALMEDARGGSSVVSVLEQCAEGGSKPDSDVIINSFYSLRLMEYSEGADISLGYLNGDVCEPTLQERCAAADALRYIATEDDIPALKRAFREVGSDTECGYEMWRYREEKSIEIVEAEPLRAKLVRAVGNRKDYDTYEWIWAVGADEDEHPKTRKVAEIYVREMLAAYEREN